MSTARLARRLFSQAAASTKASRQSWFGTGMRRGMASTQAVKETARSDTPWLVGAGTITAVGTFYLLTPPSKKAAHKAATAAHPAETANQPASSEGAAIRGEKFTGSTQEASAQPPEPVQDSEGTEASGEEIAKSSAQAYDADSPKDAKTAEEDGTSRFDDGAPGQTSAVHDEGDKPEIKEKPAKRSGTLKEEGEGGPTDLGDARKSARQEHNAPKESASSSDEKSE